MWHSTARVDGTSTTPTEPQHYTFRLKPDEQLNVRADGNRAGGPSHLDRAHPTFSVTHSAMAACPPEPLDRQFLADVAAVRAWRLEENGLYMDLAGGGTMEFRKSSQ
ncbi:MAG: META domain-containing protein [Nitrospiraceae bacterium]